MHAKRINFKNHVEIFAAKIQDHSIVKDSEIIIHTLAIVLGDYG